jgi:hypothetical protein
MAGETERRERARAVEVARQWLNQAIARDGADMRISRPQAARLLFVRWRARQGQIGGADDGADHYGGGEPLAMEEGDGSASVAE